MMNVTMPCVCLLQAAVHLNRSIEFLPTVGELSFHTYTEVNNHMAFRTFPDRHKSFVLLSLLSQLLYLCSEITDLPLLLIDPLVV